MNNIDWTSVIFWLILFGIVLAPNHLGLGESEWRIIGIIFFVGATILGRLPHKKDSDNQENI